MGKFLSFDKMITPIFIKIAFWLGVVLSLISGVGTLISGMVASNFGFIQIILGLLIILVGPIVVRVYCELLIVLFKMHESMQQMGAALANQTNRRHEEELI